MAYAEKQPTRATDDDSVMEKRIQANIEVIVSAQTLAERRQRRSSSEHPKKVSEELPVSWTDLPGGEGIINEVRRLNDMINSLPSFDNRAMAWRFVATYSSGKIRTITKKSAKKKSRG